MVPTVGLLTQIREAIAHYHNGGVGVALSVLNARRCGLVGAFGVQLGGASLTRSRWGLAHTFKVGTGSRGFVNEMAKEVSDGPC